MPRYSVSKTYEVIHAAQDGDNQAILEAIARGGSAKGFKRWQNHPALHLASTVEVAQTLIAHGADINGHKRVEQGGPEGGATGIYFSVGTALHEVNAEVAGFLISQGADLDAECAQKITPLMKATCRDDLEKMQVLIAAGCDVNRKSGRGETALHYANSAEAVVMLAAAGADLEAQNNRSATPLAVAWNKDDVAIALCNAGANPLVLNLNGCSFFWGGKQESSP